MEKENDTSDDEAPTLVEFSSPSMSLPHVTAADGEGQEQSQPQFQEAADATLPPCPVTILSGFLGSGKTTLIQYILKDSTHGKRIAVIENEFGEGLSVESIIARDGVDPNSNSLQEFIELPNGCICCTVKDSLVETLENLVAKKKDIDYILIEASGMADPGPIASVFWLDDALESRLRLDGIVTVVDAANILQQLETTEEAARQIVYSDRLLINKVDRIRNKHELEELTSVLRKLHPTAPMRTTTYSQVPDLDWILNAKCFGGTARFEELDNIWNTLPPTSNGGHDHDLDHHHHHHDCDDCHECHEHHQQEQQQQLHRHTDEVKTLALCIPGSMSLSRLNRWMADILWPQQDEANSFLMSMLEDPSKREAFHKTKSDIMQIFRIKGIVSVVHDAKDPLEAVETKYLTPYSHDNRILLDERRYIVQAVHDLWEVHAASDNLCFSKDEERLGKVIIIGKHLPVQRLEEGFRACFVEPSLAC